MRLLDTSISQNSCVHWNCGHIKIIDSWCGLEQRSRTILVHLSTRWQGNLHHSHLQGERKKHTPSNFYFFVLTWTPCRMLMKVIKFVEQEKWWRASTEWIWGSKATFSWQAAYPGRRSKRRDSQRREKACDTREWIYRSVTQKYAHLVHVKHTKRRHIQAYSHNHPSAHKEKHEWWQASTSNIAWCAIKLTVMVTVP